MQQDNKESIIVVWLYRLEDTIIGVLLSGILIFALTQIVLRNFFDTGIIWGDSLLRVLVLWLGLIGANLASRQGKQISIDVLSKFIPHTYKLIFKRLNLLFALIICLIVSYFSMQFVIFEYESKSYAFEQVPSWITEVIIPVSFLIMAIRYFVQMIQMSDSGISQDQ